MGSGCIIACNKCFTEEDLHNIARDDTKIKGTFFDIQTGGGMLCFCKEQLERIYGVYKDYKRKYRLLAAGDPPDGIYKIIKTMTGDKNIDKIIYDNIDNGFEFSETLGNSPYYCKTCKKLYTHFYFEMKNENKIYTPEYICKSCSGILEIAGFELEIEDEIEFLNSGLEDEEGNENVNFKYIIYNKKNIIKIKSKDGNIDDKLICDNCGNEDFSIVSSYCYD